MAVSDLNDLFESVDGLTEDLMEFGIIAGAAVASNMAFNAAVNFGLSKWATAPEWVGKYAVPAVAILGGALAGSMAPKYIGRRAGMGVSVGLMTAGLTRLVRTFAPSEVSQYLAGADEEIMMNGLGEGGNAFDRYLAAAPTTVEQVNGLAGSPVTVEQMNGFGYAGVASSFQ